MRRLEHKVAIVTGGASGLGKAIAYRLASEGASVAISDLNSELGNATAAGGGFLFIEHDVRNPVQWDEVLRLTEKRYGPLNILVNNAGIVGGPRDAMTPETTTLENWRNVFAVNVEGVYLGCRAGIGAMRRSGAGSIINISSIAGMLATPYNTAYGASKAAVRQLTKSVAQHCAEQRLNIRCNSVHPGDVLTPLWDKISAEASKATGQSVEEILEAQRSVTPLQEFTRPEDVAAAVAFLASDDACRVTGTKLIVDGGLVGCDTYHIVARSKAVQPADRSLKPGHK